MSESDLDNLLNDLDISDAPAEGGGEGGDIDAGDDIAAAEDAGGEAGGEGMDLADDLQAAIDDAGEGGTQEGGEGVDLADDLQAAIDDAGEGGTQEGGEGVQLDDDLAASLGGELGGEEGEGEGAEADLSALADTLGGGEQDGGAGAAVPSPVISGLTGVDADSVNVEFLLEIKLHVTFEVGRAKMLISDLLTLGQGSVIELHRLVGDELDFLVNGKLVAKGEVVVVNEKFGCRISSIVPPEDRVKYLAGT